MTPRAHADAITAWLADRTLAQVRQAFDADAAALLPHADALADACAASHAARAPSRSGAVAFQSR